MSAAVRRRFQRDVSKLNKALRAQETKSNNRFVLPSFEQKYEFLSKSERKQDMVQSGLCPGDLVYITKGEHKGKITTLFQYTPEFDTVYLSDISEKKVIPKEQWFDQQETHLIDYPTQIPREHIKLAAKDIDEKGNTCYVVAEDVVYRGKYYDEAHKRFLPKRFIKHHENIEVPWPAPPREPEDGPLSTDEQVALEKTYELQSIVVPPFPKAVLGQLRNPYSKHKSKVLSEMEARRLAAPEMPLSKEQKIYLAKKAAAEEEQSRIKDLSEEMKQLIGERIANHINGINNPHVLSHLEALSGVKIPDFEKTMNKVKEAENKQ